MKRISIFYTVLGVVIVTLNITLLYTLNTGFDRVNNKLNQLEMQIAGVRSSTNNQNSIQREVRVKEKEVFTPTELAEYLDIKLDQVYDMIDPPGVGLPYICVGGEYRFGKEAIDEWLKENKGYNIEN